MTRNIPLILLNRHLVVYHLLLCARLFSNSALSPLFRDSEQAHSRAVKHWSERSKQGCPNCQWGTLWAWLTKTVAGNNPECWRSCLSHCFLILTSAKILHLFKHTFDTTPFAKRNIRMTFQDSQARSSRVRHALSNQPVVQHIHQTSPNAGPKYKTRKTAGNFQFIF